MALPLSQAWHGGALGLLLACWWDHKSQHGDASPDPQSSRAAAAHTLPRAVLRSRCSQPVAPEPAQLRAAAPCAM